MTASPSMPVIDSSPLVSSFPAEMPALWRLIYGENDGYIGLFSGRRLLNAKLDNQKSAYFAYPAETTSALSWLEDEAGQEREVYFCAHLLKHRNRTNDDAADAITALYADRDAALIADDFPFPPSITIETSSGSYQDYWLLSRSLPPAEFRLLNHRMTDAIGADSGGWGLTKLLRPSGFQNHKYLAERTRVITLAPARIYDPDDLAQRLPPARVATPSASELDEEDITDIDLRLGEPPPRPFTLDEQTEGLERWYGRQFTYRENDPSAVDRSGSLFRLGGLMYNAGWPNAEIAGAVRNRDSVLFDEAKYAGRPWEYLHLVGKLVDRKQPVFIKYAGSKVFRRFGSADQDFWLSARQRRCRPSAPNSRTQPLVTVNTPVDSVAPLMPSVKPVPVPPFPLNVLAPAVREYVTGVATSQRVGPDMVAVPALVFAAGILHESITIAVKRDWITRPTLYAAVVGAVGDGKSPAMTAARYPLDVFEEVAHEQYLGKRSQYEYDLLLLKKSKVEDRTLPPQEPTQEHFFVSESTMEALTEYVAGQKHPVTLAADELVGWLKACDMYRGGKGTDRQTWLSIWANGPIKLGRRSRKAPFVARASVCVVGGIQPKIVEQISEGDDGFFERILWTSPEPGEGGWTEETVNSTVKQDYLRLFQQLKDKRADAPVAVSDEAKQLWIPWFNRNADLRRSTSGRLSGVHAKLPQQAARLALVLHCLKTPHCVSDGEAIDGDTMRDALAVTEYFLAHTLHVMTLLRDSKTRPHEELHDTLLNKLREKADWCSMDDIYVFFGRNKKHEEIEPELARLQSEGLIEHRTVSAGTGRPSEQWRYIERE